MATAQAETTRTYQGLPTEPLRPHGLARVAEVVEALPTAAVRVRWDSSDLRLLAHGGVLEQDLDAGWTLTLPNGEEHRAAPPAPVPGAASAPPAPPTELLDRVQSYVGGRPLQPVLRLRTRRERSALLDQGGRTLAELECSAVQAEFLTGAGRVAGWSRTRATLVDGSRRLLDALDGLLRAQGLTELPVGRAGRLPKAGSAAAALVAFLRRQNAELLALDGAVRRDEADAVHRMRVCARRLRSVLASCEKLLRKREVRELGTELRWLGQVLGAARDAETTGEQLAGQAARLPVQLGDPATGIAARFAERYAEAYRVAREVLDSERYFTLLANLERVAARPPLRDRAKRGRSELERLLRAEQRRTGGRLRAALALPEGADRDLALHGARKAAKRARYTAELAGAARLARCMRAVQDALGAYQDAIVAERLLPELAAQAHAAGEETFGYGLLYAAQRPAAAEALATAGPAWRQAGKRRLCRLG
ncbi:CYTH and CHAD domain-containing protein [Kitasatospora azatica]|uniref:CYTH and CHAD domain-containing protein n=1 Tax=Kitasatospora azatica TaxID=58347 RepID=UPI00068D71A1|nr:CHAD domain-containing protein [Kitasatospora azatica]